MMPTPQAKLDVFERKLIFRFTRAAPTILAAVALAALAVGVGMLLWSAIPVTHLPDPAVAPNPAEVAVSAAEVRAHMAPKTALPLQAPQSTAVAPLAEPKAAADPSSVRVAAEIDTLRTLVVSRGVSWADAAGPFVVDVLVYYDQGESPREVEAPSGEIYLINKSNADKKSAVLAELRRLLAGVPKGSEMAFARAWWTVRKDREESRVAAINQAEKDRSLAVLAIEAEYGAKKLEQVGRRVMAITIGGWAIGALLTAG